MTDKQLIDTMEVERVFNQWLGEADSLAERGGDRVLHCAHPRYTCR